MTFLHRHLDGLETDLVVEDRTDLRWLTLIQP
jgi:hypothetical protein